MRLAITTSPDTLLRGVKKLNHESVSPPRLVRIDDWAWRKGRRYGTIVVDLEPGEFVDLLPDSDAETVKKWLDDHPTVEVIGRDRFVVLCSSSRRSRARSPTSRRSLAPAEKLARGNRAAI
jgi:transposase